MINSKIKKEKKNANSFPKNFPSRNLEICVSWKPKDSKEPLQESLKCAFLETKRSKLFLFFLFLIQELKKPSTKQRILVNLLSFSGVPKIEVSQLCTITVEVVKKESMVRRQGRFIYRSSKVDFFFFFFAKQKYSDYYLVGGEI